MPSGRKNHDDAAATALRLPGWAWVLVKTAVVLAVLVWLRRRLPAFRPDTFLEVGWLVLLPAVLVQDLVVALVMVWRS